MLVQQQSRASRAGPQLCRGSGAPVHGSSGVKGHRGMGAGEAQDEGERGRVQRGLQLSFHV